MTSTSTSTSPSHGVGDATIRTLDLLTTWLVEHGVRQVYVLSGTGSIHLDDALENHPDLQPVCARHEAAAVLMATGHAKVSGQLAVAIVTSGPGAINAVAGLPDAFADGVPVMVISGQVETSHIDHESRSFGVQGLNVVDVAAPLTKYAALVRSPQDLGTELETAYREAMTGHQGPVWLDVPLDVQDGLVADAVRPTVSARPAAAVADTSSREVEEASSLIRSRIAAAERPLVVLGRGVRSAREADLRALLERGLPVVATRLAHDLVPYGEPLYLGQAGIRGRLGASAALNAADLVVSFGSSLSAGFLGERGHAVQPSTEVVAVNPHRLASAAHDRVDGSAPWTQVRLPAPAVLTALIDDDEWRASSAHEAWRTWCAQQKADHPSVPPGSSSDPINSYALIDALQHACPANTIFVVDTGSAYYVSGQVLEFERGQREVTSSALVNMGAALPLAVGASYADPDATIAVVVGDGAAELNMQELRTIGQYQRNIKIVVINNGGYASIRESADALCDGRVLTEPEPLSFSAVAAAFQLPYSRLSAGVETGPVLDRVLGDRRPELLEVVCDPDQHLLRPRFARAGSHDGATVRP